MFTITLSLGLALDLMPVPEALASECL